MAKRKGLSHAVLTGFKEGDKSGPRIVEVFDDGTNEFYDYPEDASSGFADHVDRLRHGKSIEDEPDEQSFRDYRKARNKELSER